MFDLFLKIMVIIYGMIAVVETTRRENFEEKKI